MKRTISILSLALALTIGGTAFATTHGSMKKGWGQAMVTCPIMKSKVAKSKAIAVKTASGKTVWVCCKSCVAQAKKLK